MVVVLPQSPAPKIKDPRMYLTCIYGPAGCGKTTWAAGIEGHLFLPIEAGCGGVEVYGGDLKILQYEDVIEILAAVILQKKNNWQDAEGNPVREIKTLVFDTGDILYELCADFICRTETFPEKGIQQRFKRVEDAPYGKGYKRAAAKLTEMFNKCRQYGFGVVVLCHSKEYIKKWRGQEFTAYRPNFPPSSCDALIAACDCVGFMEVEEAYEKDATGEILCTSSRRVLHWQQHFCYDAKHRLSGFPAEMEVPCEKGYETYADAFHELASAN